MHVVCKPGIKKHCSGTILPLPHEATEVFLHHQTLNLHKKQTRPCQTDFPVSLSGITILPGIQEDTFDSLPLCLAPLYPDSNPHLGYSIEHSLEHLSQTTES